jgi:putative ABC transport system permease protein
MRTFWLRLRTYWRRGRLSRDFDDEIAFHLAKRRERLIAEGASPDEAELAARRAFGSTLRAKESLGEVWAFRWLDDLWRDIGFALRTFRRSPVFALTAVLSLALGIGAATAIYAMAYSMLWRPMPVSDPDRLVALYQTGPAGIEDFRQFSYPELLDYRRQASTLAEVAGSTGVPLRVTDGDRPELVWGQVVTDNFFSALQVEMAAGGGFRPDEGAPVAVLNYRFWQRRYKGDPHIVGRTIGVNGHTLTIVGVTARGFTSTQLFNFVPDVTVPVRLQPLLLPGQDNWIDDRTNRWINVRARLDTNATMKDADSELNVIAERLAAAYPDTNRGLRVHVLPGGTRTHAYLVAVGTISIVAGVVGGAVILLLAIACTNLANLLLARSAIRAREIATRIAIGAGRARVIRQLLTEGLMLALAAGAVGLVIARLLAWYLWTFYPTLDFMTVDVEYDSTMDRSVYLFTLAVSLVAALLFSLGPALRASKTDQGIALRGGRRRMAPLLVATQVGLSSVLLVAGGLFVRSLQHAQTVDPGFDRKGLLIFTIDLDLQDYSRERGLAFQREYIRRLETVPGIRSAAVAAGMPLGPEDEAFRFQVKGYTRQTNEVLAASLTKIDSGYFATVGTRLVAGRELSDSDDERAPKVAVINETFARRFWQTPERALGQSFGFQSRQEWIQVVGVARDGKYTTFGESPQPHVFFPIAQEYAGRTSVVLRTDVALESILPAVRRETSAIDPGLPVLGMKTMDQFLARLVSIYQLGALLLGTFAVSALVLSSVGLFGLLHFTVTASTREIGIRMALGANRAMVMRSVLRRALRLTGSGLLVGLAGALAVSDPLGQLVAGVSGTDVTTYLVVLVVTLSVGAIAAFLPARRAAAVDPVRALHYE